MESGEGGFGSIALQHIPRARRKKRNHMSKDAERREPGATRHQIDEPSSYDGTAVLLREVLRQNRTQLREEWARRITEAQLLTAMRLCRITSCRRLRRLGSWGPHRHREERLSVLKGTFRVDSQLRRGSKLTITVPLGD